MKSVQSVFSSTTCSWINIFVDPGTTFQSTIRFEGLSGITDESEKMVCWYVGDNIKEA